MKNVTLSMSEGLLARGRAFARERGTTLNQLIRDLLAKEVEENSSHSIQKLFESADQLGLCSDGTYLSRNEAHERG
jgi:hypothetical protein